jgi:hypothetical protein
MNQTGGSTPYLSRRAGLADIEIDGIPSISSFQSISVIWRGKSKRLFFLLSFSDAADNDLRPVGIREL